MKSCRDNCFQMINGKLVRCSLYERCLWEEQLEKDEKRDLAHTGGDKKL